ncbi:hypothetical protein [Burkholderia cenocepacia]|uniref:hypothetical protein n=1 Tax=Burkholderia cenocepacia TaxID=95486 RepID=UPI001CF5102B|nr:hypothetical protein [Burkholderia cenocepacia]MCA8236611.1 hypothetical protein [Burkholderia cenocepacia]
MDAELLIKLLVPLATTLIAGAITRRLEQKPKLVTYLAHAAGFTLNPITPEQNGSPAKSSGAGGNPVPMSVQGQESAIVQQGTTPGVQVHVHGIIIRNIGKKTAFNVRVGHNIPVAGYTIEPRVHHEADPQANTGWEIRIPALVPNEFVLISYLYWPPVTWSQINSYTKSDEGFAIQHRVLPMVQPPKVVRIVIYGLLYIGIFSIGYALVSAAQWIHTLSVIVGK